MQMTPSDYYKYAVDFDGDGRRDLVHSIPDTMASAANFLVGLGWRRGEPWLQEVRVPGELPWEQADLSIKHPRAQWARWGLALADGRPLPADDLPASLLLPMGRFGPAFLAYPNFQAFLGWNSAFTFREAVRETVEWYRRSRETTRIWELTRSQIEAYALRGARMEASAR